MFVGHNSLTEAYLPAEQVSLLDSELGYPCYYVSEEQWAEKTVDYAGLVIRSYVTLATTIGGSFRSESLPPNEMAHAVSQSWLA